MRSIAAHAIVFAIFCLNALAQQTQPTQPSQPARPRAEQVISPFRNLPMNNMYIQKFITPSCFVGVMIALTFFGMCLAGIYMLMAIQAPTFFHQQKVNWGKVDFDS